MMHIVLHNPIFKMYEHFPNQDKFNGHGTRDGKLPRRNLGCDRDNLKGRRMTRRRGSREEFKSRSKSP